MCQESPGLTAPFPDTLVWRYLDFTKHISLLDETALFFGIANTLGDPFERSVPAINMAFFSTLYVNTPSDIREEIESTCCGSF